MGRAVIVRNWRHQPPAGGLAVIIDVIRFSTTLCALLQKGRQHILLAKNPKSLSLIPHLDQYDIFSELSFSSSGRRYDNSPSQALETSHRRPVAICTTTGTRAVFAARQCQQVIIGAWANFNAVSSYLKKWPGTIWLLPSANQKESPLSNEDELCARSFQNFIVKKNPEAAQKALLQVASSARITDFLNFRPKAGIEDLCVCLSLNSLPALGIVQYYSANLAQIIPLRSLGRFHK